MTSQVSRLQVAFWITLAAVLPMAFLLAWPRVPVLGSRVALLPSGGTSLPASELRFTSERLGDMPAVPALITNVHIARLDGDSTAVLACDVRRGRVVCYRRTANGQWSEEVLGDRDLLGPCGTTVVDLDADGDRDIVVPCLGSVFPTDERIGRVVLLENDGKSRFRTRILLEDLRRVSDVQAGDLDADGDLDLAVAEFGYDRGGVWWLENQGDTLFREHLLLGLPGCIHVPLVDLDGDDDLDLIALMSQEDEEVIAFENHEGRLQLRPEPLFQSDNFDLGTAGLVVCDLDEDGRPDFLLSAGDNLEIDYPAPQPWHGCYWLQNQGDWQFQSRQIAKLAGTYAAAAGDIDGDGDLDVALASMFNDWRTSGMTSSAWLQNDGHEEFRAWQIADQPTHLATIACTDLDGDGRAEVIGGSLHLQQPFNRPGRITIWRASQRATP